MRLTVPALVALLLAGCAHHDQSSIGVEPVSQRAEALSDAEVSQAVIVLNDAEVAQGRLALARSENPRIVRLARRLIEDHSELTARIRDVDRRLDLEPRSSDLSKRLNEVAADNLDQLAELRGTEFERAFVSHEVRVHQDMLDLLQTRLIPDVDKAPLRRVLDDATMDLRDHLQMAEDINVRPTISQR